MYKLLNEIKDVDVFTKVANEYYKDMKEDGCERTWLALCLQVECPKCRKFVPKEDKDKPYFVYSPGMGIMYNEGVKCEDCGFTVDVDIFAGARYKKEENNG